MAFKTLNNGGEKKTPATKNNSKTNAYKNVICECVCVCAVYNSRQ